MFYFRKKGIEKFRKTVELFYEKSNEIVRKITFRNSIDFDQFLEDNNWITKTVYNSSRFIDQVRDKFTDTIKNYNYYRVIKRHKWKIMPEG